MDARISGICPVVETPFTADGDVDYASFEALLDHLLATGVAAMMFPGFASEFHKLSDREADRLTAIFVQKLRTDGRAVPIVSVTAHATVLARKSAARAKGRGVGAVNLLLPRFLEPGRADVLDHVASVAREVAPLPVIVQYLPEIAGESVSPEAFAVLRDEHPNVATVKVEATLPEEYIRRFLALDEPMTSFVGFAGLSLPGAVRAGAVGVQPGCSFVEIYQVMWARYAAGDLAAGDHLYDRLRPFLTSWMDSPEHIVSIEKEISYRRGIIATPVVRRPGWGLSANCIVEIDKFFDEFGDEFGLYESPVSLRGGWLGAGWEG